MFTVGEHSLGVLYRQLDTGLPQLILPDKAILIKREGKGKREKRKREQGGGVNKQVFSSESRSLEHLNDSVIRRTLSGELQKVLFTVHHSWRNVHKTMIFKTEAVIKCIK